MRQYHSYNPTADMSTQEDSFRIGATHATKRRNRDTVSEGMIQGGDNATGERIASRSDRWGVVDSATCSFREDGQESDESDASSHTRGRSEASSTTLAAYEDDGKEISEGEGDSDESMEDFESDKGEDEESETSSHTVGRSEDSDSGDDGGDEDSDEEMGESDDEGDVFGESYREGSRK
ncbi:hypothetical protein J4E90_009686 [Alternaria incomplexa]|uniref:uncharacterized protein n=1 Tax=Alternaria incomplexa TaxID=1187928 RepID=UPI00221F9B5C|nr:uncharacterized protein J4E90_009686 [Alternaria incomplexa]KAI4907184.1 hypothetical protein J4E90_009686 [Alternaria incomplexa]